MIKKIIYLCLLCCLTQHTAQAQNLTQCEYWIDNDFAGRSTIAFTGTNPIETHSFTAQPQGIHTVHYRVKQQGGAAWSSVYTATYLFAQTQLLAYEYWFDSDYANKTVVAITQSTDSIFTLPPSLFTGAHCGLYNSVHIRFKQSLTGWSSVYSHRTLPCTDNTITAYRTWFDTDFANASVIQYPTPVATFQGNLVLNTAGLTVGQTYSLHAQFKDIKNNWSSVITKPYIICGTQVATITGLNAICNGQSTTLTASGGLTYAWSNGSTASNIVVTQAGTYTVTATASGGCTATNSITVTVNPLPNTSVALNDNVFTAVAAGTYQWFLNNQTIANATGQTYTATQSGNYSVQITDANGCTASSTPTFFTYIGTNVVTNTFNNINVFPNPTNGLITLNYTLEAQTKISINIFDALGKLVFANINDATQGEQVQHLNIQHLASGVYILSVQTDVGNFVCKIIKA